VLRRMAVGCYSFRGVRSRSVHDDDDDEMELWPGSTIRELLEWRAVLLGGGDFFFESRLS
jgi:hypothetical protein